MTPMDANQLQEPATNARLNHWPPHLGVRTEAEKVEYLAEQLRMTADVMTQNDDLSDENASMREEIEMHERTIGELRADIYDLNETIRVLKAKQSV